MKRRGALLLGAGVLAAIAATGFVAALSSSAPRVAATDAAAALDAGPEAASLATARLAANLDASADAGADAKASPDADSSAREPVDPRCRSLAAESARVRATIAASDPPCGSAAELLASLDHCGVTEAGTWSLVPRRFEVQRDGIVEEGKTCSEIDVEVVLVHLGALVDGAELARSEDVPFAQAAVDGGLATNWSLVGSGGWGSRSLEKPIFFDYDGDGELEVIVSGSSNDEGYDPSYREIDTYSAPGVDAGGTSRPTLRRATSTSTASTTSTTTDAPTS